MKSFAGGSNISDFHTALGQFLNYRIALEVSTEPERILYLAVPLALAWATARIDSYQFFLRFEPAITVIKRYEVRLIIYNPGKEEIEQWIN